MASVVLELIGGSTSPEVPCKRKNLPHGRITLPVVAPHWEQSRLDLTVLKTGLAGS
jgi:hypothetical protein